MTIRRSADGSRWEILTLYDSTGYERWEPLGTFYAERKFVEFGVESLKVFETVAELLIEEGWTPPEF